MTSITYYLTFRNAVVVIVLILPSSFPSPFALAVRLRCVHTPHSTSNQSCCKKTEERRQIEFIWGNLVKGEGEEDQDDLGPDESDPEDGYEADTVQPE